MEMTTNSFYLFPNDSDNKWIAKYNELVTKVKTENIVFDRKLSKHHIIPRSLRPDLTEDKDNWVMLPFAEHMDLHYYLWKADPIYASKLWFGCVFGRKHKWWDLPGGDEEYEQLKKDLKLNKKHKKNEDTNQTRSI